MKKILCLICLILFFISPSFAKELKIVQISDVHLSSSGEGSDYSRNVSDTLKHLKLAVLSVNKLKKVDFVMFSGDVIDKSDPDELVEFFKIVNELKYPYYVLMGNHDVHSVAGMPKEDFLKIVSAYNPNQKKATANYSFYPKKGFMVAVVDGTLPVIPGASGYFSQDTMSWLNKVLDKNIDKKVLIFQHYPLLPPEENKSHMVLNPQKYNKILDNHDNVVLIASGHFHKAKVQKDKRGIIHISSPALLNDPGEYRIIDIKYSKPLFSKVKNIEVWTSLKKI